MTRGRATRAGLALVALVLLAGCATIPSSGEVQSYSGSSATSKDQVIRTIARKPPDGASQTEIVAGFLTASASFEADHAFARSYLTEPASKAWQPDKGVAVYDSDPGYQLGTSGDSVQMLALRSAGTITQRGVFEQPTGSAQYRATFSMTKEGGQWRIKGLPNGLILSTGDIARAFRSVDMFFLDVAGGVLVPDPIFLPTLRPGIATALTRELLTGPTDWLAPAVRTGFPSGSHLAVDAVPVEDGVARVDLDRSAVAATGDERRQIAAQLTYTLTQLPNVGGVRITLEGVPFSVPGVGSVSTLTDWESFDPDAAPLDDSTYAIDDGHLAVVSTTPTALPGYFGRTKNLTAAAVAHDGQLAAGISPTVGGDEVRLGGVRAASVPVAYRGERITSVSFDRLNSAWIADRYEGRTRVRALRAGREPLAVLVEGLGTRSIETLRVARDGARIALVVADRPGGTGTLLVGRVERGTGSPVVAGLRRVENSLSSVSDVAWADDTSLLVVARRTGEPVQSFLVGIDGDSVAGAGAVPSMLTVAACPGRPYLAGTATDTLWVDRGTGWRLFVTGSVPIYPG